MPRGQSGLAGNCQASSGAGPMQGKAGLVRKEHLSSSRYVASCASFPHPPTSPLRNRPCFLAYFAKNGPSKRNSQWFHWLFRLKCLFEGDLRQITSDFTGYFHRSAQYGANRPFFMGYFGCRAINPSTQRVARQDLLPAAAQKRLHGFPASENNKRSEKQPFRAAAGWSVKLRSASLRQHAGNILLPPRN